MLATAPLQTSSVMINPTPQHSHSTRRPTVPAFNNIMVVPPDDNSSCYNIDLLSIMMEQEYLTYEIPFDYLKSPSKVEYDIDYVTNDHIADSDDRINGDDRKKLVDWCYKIVDQFDFSRDTVSITMNIVDRYMCLPSSHSLLYDRVEYQLVAVAALYTSIKINEAEILSSGCLSALSRDVYSIQDIEDMERNILHGLEWRMNPPTSQQVGYQILALLLVPQAQGLIKKSMLGFIQDELAYQAENAVRYPYFMTSRPSVVAISAILNGIEQANKDRCYEDIIQDGLVPIIKAFDFGSPLVVLAVKNRLHGLIYEHEKEEEDR